jgi:hypothetical protein
MKRSEGVLLGLIDHDQSIVGNKKWRAGQQLAPFARFEIRSNILAQVPAEDIIGFCKKHRPSTFVPRLSQQVGIPKS